MLDDLRRNYDDDDDDIEVDNFRLEEDDEDLARRRFLGMTAVERMFLSIFFFLNVVVLGLAFLVVTGRVQF